MNKLPYTSIRNVLLLIGTVVFISGINDFVFHGRSLGKNVENTLLDAAVMKTEFSGELISQVMSSLSMHSYSLLNKEVVAMLKLYLNNQSTKYRAAELATVVEEFFCPKSKLRINLLIQYLFF